MSVVSESNTRQQKYKASDNLENRRRTRSVKKLDNSMITADKMLDEAANLVRYTLVTKNV